jgi:hypothetical protein
VEFTTQYLNQAPFELAVSLLILVAHTVPPVLVLDHFIEYYCTNITHKGYQSDVKFF